MEPKQLTDRLEANTALMMELDDRVEKRVMEIIQKNITNISIGVGGSLPYDSNFIANVGRKLGERDARNWSS